MKTSLHWLNRYLDRPAELDEATQTLTDLGFPTEEWESINLSTGRSDWQMDVEITNNRGDCLSHIGQAREVAAATGRSLQFPSFDLPADAADDVPVADLTRVDNDAPDLCPVYTVRVIRGVKIGPSPDWLVEALEAVGQKPVNNVVDITNYVLLETGQPLHAFDMTRLGEGRIVVRRAKKDEPFEAIDHSKHKLRDDMLVIADANKPVAIAGVMGGVDSEVGGATTDVLLESAAFSQLSVRQTSRRLKLGSDSSYRFERGVDPCGVERASRRAAQFIVELAGGKIADGVIRVGVDEPQPSQVLMRTARCNALLGTDLSVEAMRQHLERLDLQPHVNDGEGTILCTVPTFRLDLQREVDLIEEVARLHGMADIPVQEKIEITVRNKQPDVTARQSLVDALIAHGYLETVGFTFVDLQRGKSFLPKGHEPLTVGDETRKSEPMLRPSLLPTLLATRKTNQDYGNKDLRLFETAATFSRDGASIVETARLALIADAEDKDHALRDLRGTLEELSQRLVGEAAMQFDETEDDHFAAAATVTLRGKPLGVMGLIDSETQDAFDLQTPLVAAELELQPLLASFPPDVAVEPLSRYPAIERDLSVVVDESVRWADVREAIDAARPALLEDVRFLITYRGKPIARGSKSVSFRMIFRDPNGTLRHDQVDPQVEAVAAKLKDAVSAELRT